MKVYFLVEVILFGREFLLLFLLMEMMVKLMVLMKENNSNGKYLMEKLTQVLLFMMILMIKIDFGIVIL